MEIRERDGPGSVPRDGRIDGEGHGAPNSWLRLSSIVLYDITAALSSKSSRT